MTAQGPGEAVQNANSYSSYDSGMCLKWVRGPDWEIGSLYGSAIDAWYGARYKHPGDRNPPKGAPCFYSGGQYGHIVIAKDSGMRSTDCPSTGRVGDAALNWPEVAWGDKYLGWTEDLNGVRLPGLVPEKPEQPDNGGDEDVPDLFIMKNTGKQSIPAGVWQRVSFPDDGAVPIQHGSRAGIGGHKYTSTFYGTLTPKTEKTIRTRTANVEKKGDDWVVSNVGRQVEHAWTSGATYVQDTRASQIGSSYQLTVEVYLEDGGTLEDARWEILRF